MPDVVKFSKGLSNTMPATLTPGQFLIQTDTGNMYLDNSSTERVQIKDDTKLPLTGGTLTGSLTIQDITIEDDMIYRNSQGSLRIGRIEEGHPLQNVYIAACSVNDEADSCTLNLAGNATFTTGNVAGRFIFTHGALDENAHTDIYNNNIVNYSGTGNLGASGAMWNNLYVNNILGVSCGLNLSSAAPVFYRENSTTGNRIQIDGNGFNFITSTSFIKIQNGNIIPNVSGTGGIGTATNKWNSVYSNLVDGLTTPQETENTKAANVEFVKNYVEAHAGGTGSGLPSGGSPDTILIGSAVAGEGQWTSTMPQAVVIDDGVFS